MIDEKKLIEGICNHDIDIPDGLTERELNAFLLGLNAKQIAVMNEIKEQPKIDELEIAKKYIEYFKDERSMEIRYRIVEQPKVGEWIPCAERLPSFYPKKQRRVLVTVEDLSGKRFVTTAKYDETYEQWKDFKDPRYCDFKVVAWQTKPEPYKEGCK